MIEIQIFMSPVSDSITLAWKAPDQPFSQNTFLARTDWYVLTEWDELINISKSPEDRGWINVGVFDRVTDLEIVLPHVSQSISLD